MRDKTTVQLDRQTHLYLKHKATDLGVPIRKVVADIIDKYKALKMENIALKSQKVA